MKRYKVFEIENASSSSDRIYATLIWSDGTTSCNCPGWIYSKSVKGCKHTKKITMSAAARQTPLTEKIVAAAQFVAVSEEALLAQQLEASIAMLTPPVRKFRLPEVAHA